MENWIDKNKNKILLICVMFTMWCFYSIVKQGGGIIPRVKALEIESIIHKQRAEEFSFRLIEHIESIHYGRVNDKSNLR